jgi:hypothetical protein
MHWKVVSKRLRDFRKCIVLPIGSLSMGLCRHRAILFKVMKCSVCLGYQKYLLLVLKSVKTTNLISIIDSLLYFVILIWF